MTGGVPGVLDVAFDDVVGDTTAEEDVAGPPTSRWLCSIGAPPTATCFISGTLRAATTGIPSVPFFRRLGLMQKKKPHNDSAMRMKGMMMPIAAIAGNGGW